jgi:hypothetical protein
MHYENNVRHTQINSFEALEAFASKPIIIGKKKLYIQDFLSAMEFTDTPPKMFK